MALLRLALALLLALALPAAHAQEPVARVTLVAGEAVRLAPDGSRTPLAEGAPLYEGDTIETPEGATVHLAFRDEARIALKPGSRLTLTRYRTEPGAERLELDLPQGALRQITGEAAHRDPAAYRLRTPIVAIGVRGTDFAVHTDAERTETLLNRGAILLAPRAACAELTGCGALIEVTPDRPAWRIERNGAVQPLPPAERQQLAPLLGARTNPAPSAATDEREAKTLSALSALSTAAPSNTPPQRLAWGRWFSSTGSEALPLYHELLAAGLAPAAGSTRYVLLREDPAGDGKLSPAARGRIDFRLQDDLTSYVRADGIALPATLSQAHLRIDFDARTFDTAATLSHPAAGSYRLGAAGALSDSGLFGASTASSRILGATALDGQSAGVLYEKTLPAGARLESLTRWQR